MSRRIIKTKPTRNPWKSFAVPSLLYFAIGILLFLGSCGIAQSQGWMQTTGQSTTSGLPVGASGASGAEIKGSWTIRQVMDVFKVSQSDFYREFKIPEGTSPDARLNTLENSAPGFSVEAVRTWIDTILKNGRS